MSTSRTLSHGATLGRTTILLDEHRGVDQAHLSETIGESLTIHERHDRGLAPMVGVAHLADEERLTRLIAISAPGRTAVCHDIDADPTIWPGQAAVITGAGAKFLAFVAVPLRYADAWVAILAVRDDQRTPYRGNDMNSCS